MKKAIVIEDGFDFGSLQKMAVCHFSETPKAMTLMQHTMLVDTTEVFCVYRSKMRVQIFVPKQWLYSVRSKQGAEILFLKISLEEGKEANLWLAVYSEHRQGFLFPENFITFDKRSRWMKIVDFFYALAVTRTGRGFSCASTFFV
jgi:hypothetical protein